jgi:hypothetical protein
LSAPSCPPGMPGDCSCFPNNFCTGATWSCESVSGGAPDPCPSCP